MRKITKWIKIIAGMLILLLGLLFFLLESGASGNKSNTSLTILTHILIALGGLMVGTATAKK